MQASVPLQRTADVQYVLRIGDTALVLAQRLAARVKAWDDGAWVRDAATAHARKQSQRELAA